MSELAESDDYYSYPKILERRREEFGLKELGVDSLTMLAASQDSVVAEQAQKRLEEKWALAPDKDVERAPSVDLMEQLSQYTEEERKLMISQMTALQLTEGCNGGCPFCFLGVKKGVVSKYSFESISAFFKQYGHLLSESLVLYYDSDPFDYREGGHSYVDVYRAWRKVKPKGRHFISTTIPRGSPDSFIEFMRNVINERKEEQHEGNPQPLVKVRISLGKHNTQRVEATIKKLTKVLLGDGHSQRVVDRFYRDHLEEVIRFGDNIQLVGPLIKGHEDVRDIFSPACADGVVLTPKSCRAIMVTVPTIHEPSGERAVDVLPGQVDAQVPYPQRTSIFANLRLDDSLLAKDRKQVMLSSIKTHDGQEYKLADPCENLVLRLGRETASIGRLITALSRPGPSSTKRGLGIAAKEFRKRQVETREQIARAVTLIEEGSLSEVETEKLGFYILLTETYLTEMDFLADQIEVGRQTGVIRAIAVIFRQIGREQIKELPMIIEGLVEIGETPTDDETGRNSVKKIKTKLLEIVGRPFGFDGYGPFWFQEVVGAYVEGHREKFPFVVGTEDTEITMFRTKGLSDVKIDPKGLSADYKREACRFWEELEKAGDGWSFKLSEKVSDGVVNLTVDNLRNLIMVGVNSKKVWDLREEKQLRGFIAESGLSSRIDVDALLAQKAPYGTASALKDKK